MRSRELAQLFGHWIGKNVRISFSAGLIYRFWHRNSSSKVNIKTELQRKMNRKRRKKNNSQKPIRIFMSSFPHESHTPRTTSLIERLYIQHVSCVHVSDFWFLWICFWFFFSLFANSTWFTFYSVCSFRIFIGLNSLWIWHNVTTFS